MSDHFIIQCSCGTLLAQCRCLGHPKTVSVRLHACADCQALLLGGTMPPLLKDEQAVQTAKA